MLINTCDELFERSTVKLLETFINNGCRVYKILLSINRYESSKFSPLAMDNIVMTIYRNKKRCKICYNVQDTTSPRCRFMFDAYKEALAEFEFANYIRALYYHIEGIAEAVGVAGQLAHIIRYEAWHNEILAMS